MRAIVHYLAFGIIAIIALIVANPAQADVICAGVPGVVLIDTNGYLLADWGYGGIYICNVNSASSGTPGQTPLSADGCKLVFHELLTAQTTGKNFGLYVVGVSTCAGLRGSNGWPTANYSYFAMISS